MAIRQGHRIIHADMERALHADEVHETKNVEAQLFSEDKSIPSQPPNNLVAKPLLTRHSPNTIQNIPIHGLAENNTAMNRFYRKKLKSYLASATENELLELAQICGTDFKIFIPDNLLFNINVDPETTSLSETDDPPLFDPMEKNKDASKTGKKSSYPDEILKIKNEDLQAKNCHNKENTNVMESNAKNIKRKKSKRSRNSRKSSQTTKTEKSPFLPNGSPPPGFSSVAASVYKKETKLNEGNIHDEQLVPGSDILITIRIYKRFDYDKYETDTEGVFENLFYHDLILTGRHSVADIMDRFICSEKKENCKEDSAGFIFIKNAFYVDKHEASNDQADSLRAWCEMHKLGNFPKRDMHNVRLDQLDYKLGNPDVYIHNTMCEHIIIFSEVRLLDARDPLRKSSYPRISSIAYNKNTAFCYNCADLNPHWIVAGCARVPLNMALYCQKCYKTLLFDKNDKRICKFKSYPYKGLDIEYNSRV